jgi:DNA-binding HxlR family transcriptional regulator
MGNNTIENEEQTSQICMKRVLAVKDALDTLNGRWRLPIMICLLFGTKRFKQISKEINGITDRMLSKELKDLELNKLVERNVYGTFPPTVEYSITTHGKSLEKVIVELFNWGSEHRKKIIGK